MRGYEEHRCERDRNRDSVTEPVSARYGWYSWGPAPLFNGDGLPAAPFQSRV